MSFQVALLVFGTLLLLLGLVGKIKAREFEVGTTNTLVRFFALLLGGGFIAGAFFPNAFYEKAETKATASDAQAAQAIALRPLNLYYSPRRADYFTTATAKGILSAGEARYTHVRLEGCVLASHDPSRESVPLRLYYHDGDWKDNFTAARPESETEAYDNGYGIGREEEGFVYVYRYPGTVPLKLYKRNDGKDYLTIATKASDSWARSHSYDYIRDEAYIYPKEHCL